MTQTQREKWEKMKSRKPRPREFFDVQKIMNQREKMAIERIETRRKIEE